MGQFPATAYLYRMGLVKEAPPVVEADLNVADLKALKGAPVSGPVNLDELRKADIPAGRTAAMQGLNAIDPRAYYVGKVAMNFTDAPGALRLSRDARDLFALPARNTIAVKASYWYGR
jgi:hypothetical protein